MCWEFKMTLWEFSRDSGLLIFATGGVFFGLGRILHRQLGSADIALLAIIGDAAMLGGACLAILAMTIGHFISGENPS